MSFSLIAHTIAQPGVNGGASGAIDTSGSSLLVLSVAAYAGGIAGPVSVSDSKSNTWNPLTRYAGSVGNGEPSSRIYYVINPIVGSGHTFSATGTNIFPTFMPQAYSGADTSSPFDVENGTADSTQPGTVTPGFNNELLVCLASWNIAPDTSVPAINSGFTISDTANQIASTAIGGASAYKIQTTAGAENPVWSGLSSTPTTVIATFKAAVAGGASHLYAQSKLDAMSGTGWLPGNRLH